VLAATLLFAPIASAQEMICYDNADGGRVCGDTIPPEHARFDRVILNAQGVIIRVEQGEITPEEQAAIDAQLQREQQTILEAEERRRYGQMLLDSYSSVASIESLRDRMVDEVKGQIAGVELYLTNLNTKLEGLERRAQRFSPYSEEADAPPMPLNLATDIERTESSIKQFEQRLEESHRTLGETRDNFEQDIAYFRQLKGLGA